MDHDLAGMGHDPRLDPVGAPAMAVPSKFILATWPRYHRDLKIAALLKTKLFLVVVYIRVILMLTLLIVISYQISPEVVVGVSTVNSASILML